MAYIDKEQTTQLIKDMLKGCIYHDDLLDGYQSACHEAIERINTMPATSLDAKIDLPNVIIIDGKKYYITASRFPTINEKDYYWEFDYESIDLCRLLKREDKKANIGIAERLDDAMLSLKVWLKENGYVKGE